MASSHDVQRKIRKHLNNAAKLEYSLQNAKDTLNAVKLGLPAAKASVRLNRDILLDSQCFNAAHRLLLHERYKSRDPRALRSVQNLLDPEALLPVFTRPRTNALIDFDIEHPLRMDPQTGVYSAVKYRQRPKFETRDQYNLLFLRNLEVFKQDLGELDVKQRWTERERPAKEDECGRIYSRNWAMVEENSGKNLGEFIAR